MVGGKGGDGVVSWRLRLWLLVILLLAVVMTFSVMRTPSYMIYPDEAVESDLCVSTGITTCDR